MEELLESNDILHDSAALNARLEEEGYLFVRELLDPQQVLRLRREMLTVMQQGGWIAAGGDPLDGIADPDARSTEGDPEYTDVYHEVYKLQSFHEIAHSRRVLDLMERIRGCPMMPQPQKVARLWFPQFTEHTTPVHQDFVHFQGCFDNLTCWSPVGDCPRELGGLAVLRGSHHAARVLPHHFSLGAGSLVVREEDQGADPSQWRTTDYRVGDALIFPFLTVHKALPNLTPDRLRVSLDNRYQRVGDPIAEHMLLPHLNSMSPLGWDEVYADWTDTSLQHYWESLENPVHARIMEYSDTAFREAMEMAQAGDERARLHLQRIVRRDPGAEQAVAAAAVLEQL